MKTWTKILPFFIVEHIAKKNLQKSTIAVGKKEVTIVKPYKGVYISVEVE